MAQTATAPVRDRESAAPWGLLLALGVVSMLFGAVILIWPQASVRVMATVLGFWLVLGGAVRIITAFLPGPMSVPRHILAGIVGVVVFIAGLFCLRNLVQSVAILAVVVATTWMLSGITEVVWGLQQHGAARIGLVGVGVLSIVLGLVFLGAPKLSLASLVLMSGLSGLIGGLVEVVVAFRLRKAPAG
jgi:uncharacterized membrane protein HdeD (DUF308 family)